VPSLFRLTWYSGWRLNYQAYRHSFKHAQYLTRSYAAHQALRFAAVRANRRAEFVTHVCNGYSTRVLRVFPRNAYICTAMAVILSARVEFFWKCEH
jgi:hypothetical protein